MEENIAGGGGVIKVVADTHGIYEFNKILKAGRNLAESDYLVVVGDFGVPWSTDPTNLQDTQLLAALNILPYTVLVVDGNHENHSYLDQLTGEKWNGGMVGKIAANVLHLQRGNIYTIEGKRIWVFGGATSVDKHARQEGVDWWPREVASYAEMSKGVVNLEEVGNEVDYIITHTAPRQVAAELVNYWIDCPVANYLDFIYDHIRYKRWICGHFHVDGVVKGIEFIYKESVVL